MNCYILILFCTVYVYMKNEQWDAHVECMCVTFVLHVHVHIGNRERYCIIYIWKTIEGLAPNFSNPITSTFSGRRGRSCVISHVNVGHIGTMSYNSFRWRSIHLFNLPMHLRSISSCSVLRYKTHFDIFLGSVDDLPCLPGFNNSLDGGDCRWWSPRDGMATN